MLCPDLQAEDLEKLALAGCAAVFMPTASLYHPGGTTTTSTDGGAGNAGAHVDASMVVGAQGEAADPEAHETWVTVEHLSQGLCAKSRPHFFRGVCTVSWAVQWRGWGGCDGKQRGLVVRVWACLRCPIPHCRCRSCPRCCSRNALLTPEDRRRCVCISQGLAEARQAAEAGTATAAQQLQRLVADWVSGGGGRVDYVEVVNAHTLRPVAGDVRGQLVLIAVAALFGKVRLIDNVEVEVGAAVAATI